MNLPLPTDRVSRVARKWSNQILRQLAPHFIGDIINVSGWDDRDKEGGHYRDYFAAGRSYSISNYSGERGTENDSGASDLHLDLVGELPENLRQAFDVVFNHTTLEHVFDVNTAFANLCRMSRDVVIVVVPFAQVTHTTDSFGDYWRFCPMALREMFLANDLSIVYEAMSTQRNAGTYLLFVGSREPGKWRDVLPDHDIIQQVGGWIGETTTRRLIGKLAAVRNALRGRTVHLQ
jgi:hypothetical protein